MNDADKDHCGLKIRKSVSLLNHTNRPVKEHPFFKPIGRGVKVNSQAKQIVLNVLFHIHVIRPKESVNSVVALTSKFTGVSERTIYRLKSEKEQFEHNRNLDEDKPEPVNTESEEINDSSLQSVHNAECGTDFVGQNVSATISQPGANRLKSNSTSKTHTKIRDPPSPRAERKKFTKPAQKRLARIDPVTVSRLKAKVNECLQWKDRPQPTVNQIMEIVNEDPSLPNYKRSTFWRIMCDLGFQKTKSAGKRKSSKTTKSAVKNSLSNFGSGPIRETPGSATMSSHYAPPVAQNPNNLGVYVSATTTSTQFQYGHKPIDASSDYAHHGVSGAGTCYYAPHQ